MANLKAGPRRRISLLAYALAASFASGCSVWPESLRPLPDVSPQRRQRANEAAKAFDEQREAAEYQAAESCWKRDDVDGCRVLLQRLLKHNPQHREGGLLMTQVLLGDGKTEEARRQLEPLKQKYPDDPAVLHTAGLLLEAEGNSPEAVRCFELATKLAPSNEVYALSYEAAVAEPPSDSPAPRTAARPVAVIAAADESEGGESGNDARIGDATTDDAAARNGLPAQTSSRRRINMPATARELVERGGRALAAGSADNAKTFFHRACEAAPDDPQIPLSAVVLALREDELELALQTAEQGVRTFPESASLYRALGTAQYRLADYKGAKASFEQALALDNSSALSYFLMGSTLEKLGRTEAARTYFVRAQRLDPKCCVRR